MRLDKKAVKALCAGVKLKDVEKVDASNKDIDEASPMTPPLSTSNRSPPSGMQSASVWRNEQAVAAGDRLVVAAAPAAAGSQWQQACIA